MNCLHEISDTEWWYSKTLYPFNPIEMQYCNAQCCTLILKKLTLLTVFWWHLLISCLDPPAILSFSFLSPTYIICPHMRDIFVWSSCHKIIAHLVWLIKNIDIITCLPKSKFLDKSYLQAKKEIADLKEDLWRISEELKRKDLLLSSERNVVFTGPSPGPGALSCNQVTCMGETGVKDTPNRNTSEW